MRKMRGLPSANSSSFRVALPASMGLLMGLGGMLSGCASLRTDGRPPALLVQGPLRPEPLPTPREWQVVAFAKAQVGKRYCWGGAGPGCFDCSGLVKKAWARVGVRLPHSSEAIPDGVPEVPRSEVRPGDILWWRGHLALYAGSGWSIEALNSRDGVVLRPARVPDRVFRPPG